MESFEEFWPFYLAEHSRPETRWLHFAGTTAVLGMVAWAVARRDARGLKWAPLVGYGPAWVAHYCIEKNRPATFKYPGWSLRADLRMWYRMVRGTLEVSESRESGIVR